MVVEGWAVRVVVSGQGSAKGLIIPYSLCQISLSITEQSSTTWYTTNNKKVKMTQLSWGITFVYNDSNLCQHLNEPNHTLPPSYTSYPWRMR